MSRWFIIVLLELAVGAVAGWWLLVEHNKPPEEEVVVRRRAHRPGALTEHWLRTSRPHMTGEELLARGNRLASLIASDSDDERRLRWFFRAAEQDLMAAAHRGQPGAWLALAWLHRDHELEPTLRGSFEKARGYFALAVGVQPAEAHYGLGYLFEQGVGATGYGGNLVRAEACYRVAAELGDADAAFRVGKLHCMCAETREDLERALSWYERAAELGHPHAQNEMDQTRQALNRNRTLR